MEVQIEFSTPQKGKFSDIKLCYIDTSGMIQKVSLNIDFDELYEFGNETNSVAFEFFLISSIVYGVDNLITRDEYSVNCWTREIKVCFPVYSVEKWNDAVDILTDSLNFLTGDFWDISFQKLEMIRLFSYDKKKKKTFDKDNYQYISLFSGGLDSLVGVIDFLESLPERKRALLVSHFDSNAVGPSKDQTTLNSFLEGKYRNKSNWIQTKVHLSHYNSDGAKIEIEPSYRSRSLMFIAIGVYLQSSVKNTNELYIPENGTISLNYPMTPSRSSSLSTRTTHPYFFLKVQELLNTLEINCNIKNPYSLLTKGELVAQCKNVPNLKEICEASVSCSKSGRKMYWDQKTGTRHCGVCIPCVYRRSGLHKIGADNQRYGIDILNKESPSSHDDIFALATYLNDPLDIEQIKRGLITNSSLLIDKLDEYAELIMRSREEVRTWIKEKGNDKIKSLFQIT